jgi:hypothetical protein
MSIVEYRILISPMQSLKLSFSVYSNGPGDDFTTVNLDPLFRVVDWPNLNNLMLYGVHLSPSVALRFFSSHPSILSFRAVEATAHSQLIKPDCFDHTYPKTSDRLCFPPNTLPNLKSFKAPEYFTLSLLTSPTSSPRLLTELKLTITDEALEIFPRLPSLKVLIAGLISEEQLKRLAAVLPDLVELSARPANLRQKVWILFIPQE